MKRMLVFIASLSLAIAMIPVTKVSASGISSRYEAISNVAIQREIDSCQNILEDYNPYLNPTAAHFDGSGLIAKVESIATEGMGIKVCSDISGYDGLIDEETPVLLKISFDNQRIKNVRNAYMLSSMATLKNSDGSSSRSGVTLYGSIIWYDVLGYTNQLSSISGNITKNGIQQGKAHYVCLVDKTMNAASGDFYGSFNNSSFRYTQGHYFQLNLQTQLDNGKMFRHTVGTSYFD